MNILDHSEQIKAEEARLSVRFVFLMESDGILSEFFIFIDKIQLI